MKKKTKGHSPKVDMTPMIDCIFLLIIFFVVSTQIVTDVIPLEPPESELALLDDLNDPCVINISSQGEVFVGSERCVTWDDAKKFIERKASQAAVDENGFSEMELYIRGDTISKWKKVQEIITIAASDCRPKVCKTIFATQVVIK